MSEHEDFARFRTAIMVCLEPEPAQDALAFLDAMRARQARTIRRLRALADGYRDGLDDAIAKSKFVGARFERARIVAWLRGDCVHRDMGCDCHVIADAIERGEL